jgi:hypothetical protein
VLTQKNQYWATTAGNHDVEGDLDRDQISEIDRFYKHSLTKPNMANITHTFNYYLPVYGQDGLDI